VDFAKTGMMPPDLTTKSKNELPPERADHYPDFMGNGFKPSYFSPRLLGQIYRCICTTGSFAKFHLNSRRLKAVDDVYSLTENEVQAHVEVDEDLEINGWQHSRYMLKARLQRNKYSAEIRVLLTFDYTHNFFDG
jgi:hypothetical protein